MKFKKAIALLLTAAMSMTMLVGCGGTPSNGGTTSEKPNDGSPEKVTLKVWVPEEEVELTQAMCAAFDEAHPEYECTFDIAVVGIDESVGQIETDLDLAADVFQLPSGSISQVVDAGLLLPITVDINNVKSLYGEGALEACTRGDLLYGVPFSPNSWFMYYNKDMYTEEEVKSLDTMMAKNFGEGVYNFSCDITNSWYIEAFFYAAGCTLYGPDGTDPKDCTWNNADGLTAANYIIDLVNNPKYLEEADSIAGAMMKEGKLGAFCSGTWAVYGEDKSILEALGDKLGACALPTIKINGKECQLSNFADYKAIAVKSSTKHPKAAQLLAEWLGNADNQLKRYQEVGASPTCLSLMDNADIAADFATAALLAQTQYATAQPSISQIGSYWTPVQALGEGIVNGTITKENIQESLDTVVNDVTSSLTD